MRDMLRYMNEPKGDNIKENTNVVKQWNKVTKTWRKWILKWIQKKKAY